MKGKIHVLGIDIAKAKFDVCLLLFSGTKRERSFANNIDGIAELLHWLKEQCGEACQIGIEATGCYWILLASQLHAAGYVVYLLNPAYVKAHIQSNGRRSKTDRIDAQWIADYVCTHDCERWEPLTAEVEELRELMRLYADMTAINVRVKQRKESIRTEAVQRLHEEIALSVKTLTHKVLQAAKDHVKRHAGLKQKVKCLKSVKGIGAITALIFVAELPAGRSARKVSAWAGVTPRHHESGQTVYKRPRLSKQGNDYVRHSLYWPAITAIRFNPAMQSFAARLRAAGLNKMQVIGAAMHKLLRWAVGIMNSNTCFDPTRHLNVS
jgi:transposase